MITRILCLVFLLLTHSHCFDYHIEYDRCAVDTACFIRESCIVEKTGAKTLVEYKNEALNNGICDVVLQIKPFNKVKWHVMLQVNASTSNHPISSEGIVMKQGITQFQCSKNKLAGNEFIFSITKFGTGIYEDNFIFCSFIAESLGKDKFIPNIFYSNGLKPSIQFTTESVNSVEFAASKDDLWNVPRPKCDPDMIKSPESTDGINIMKPVEATHSELRCDVSEKLLIVREQEGSVYPATNVKCLPSRDWGYEHPLETAQIIPETESFSAYCTRPICTLCSPPARYNCDTCSDPTPGNSADNSSSVGCKTLSCSKERQSWLLFDGRSFDGSLRCKKKDRFLNNSDYGWFYNDKADEKLLVEAASCATEGIDCSKKAELKEECPASVSCQKDSIRRSGDLTRLKCSDSNIKLRYTYAGTTNDTINLICNSETGMYKDDDKRDVPIGSTIFCGVDHPVAAAASTGNMSLVIGGGAFIFILVITVVPVIFVLRRRRKRAVESAARRAASKQQRSGGTADQSRVDKNNIVKEQISRELSEVDVPEAHGSQGFSDSSKSAKPSAPETSSEITPSEDLITGWTDDTFMSEILPKFTRYSAANRRKVLDHLTVFNQDTLFKDQVPVTKAKGHVGQFIHLYQECADSDLVCPTTWETMWRVMKRLHYFVAKNDDDRMISYALQAFIANVAKKLFAKYNLLEKEGESADAKWMRFVTVRMMLWYKDSKVTAEVAKLADANIHSLQTPLRAIVFAYAVRNLNRTEEFKRRNWAEVTYDPATTLTADYGTIRQHVLFGICSAIDEAGKTDEEVFKFAKNILAQLYDFNDLDYACTPTDHLWAYRGMADDARALDSVVKTIRTQTQSATPNQWEAMIKHLTDANALHRLTIDEMEKCKLKWKESVVDLLVLVAESCNGAAQFEEFCEAGRTYYNHRMFDCPRAKTHFNLEMLRMRALNWEKMFDSMIKALTACGYVHDAMLKHQKK